METVSVQNNRLSKQTLNKIVAHLKSGSVIVYPTETAYAVGGDALNKEVIKKIYAIKRRSVKLPLPVIVGDLKQARKFVMFNSPSLLLAKKFWPGALTLVLKKKKNIPAMLTARKPSLAVRVSGNKIARTIADELGRPIISTSANQSKGKECYSVSAIKKQIHGFDQKIDLVVDAGKLPEVKPSTIVKVASSKIIILRKGSVVV
ncbi:MAG: L-threonylcarbamoyladenylate synthase [Patescibacteria group bacterium]|jgi:L-threonylcarbamoyladenylate synthase